MSWWLANVSRVRAEQTALAQLLESVEWLSGVNWRVGDDLQLIVDFDVKHNDETFNLVMKYPSTFPDTPSMVLPRDGQRLSFHQYGSGGELCLEFRPDNWDPSVTGAMMAESAYRLLSGERPDGNQEHAVWSAHQASIGRDARGERMRFMLDPSIVEVLAGLPAESPISISAWERLEERTWVASLVDIGDSGAIWSQSGLQPSHSLIAKGFAVRTTREVDCFRANPGHFAEALVTEWPKLAEHITESPFNGFVLLGDADKWIALNLYAHEGKQTVFGYKVILTPSAAGRLPANHAGLSQKRVAIVGCGSVGSKIATTLARSGICKFTLVDDDIFFQGNLVRNDLDARAIGQHKVDALAVRIKDIVANTAISVRRVSLGQQESAGTTESVMEELAQADLLIEATADPRAFNLMAAVARRQCKPMVWCEVFAGGIGGIIARARPEQDPIPTIARAQIRAWCDGHEVPWTTAAQANYGAQWEQGAPLIADDADVSVIAGHTSRLALDTLTREQSIFPSSAYALGLTADWIFRAPFDTWPINLQPEGKWGELQDDTSKEDLKELLTSLLPGPAV